MGPPHATPDVPRSTEVFAPDQLPVSTEIKGKDHVQNDASKFGFTDVEISTSVWKLGTLKYGKIKEPFVYEMVGDAANLQEQERALNPFS
jgi:hypothetical protein